MEYRSTRGGSAHRSFAEVLLEGLAPDGGLYVPDTIPTVQPVAAGYASTVASVMVPFVEPDPLAEELDALCHDVYRRFRHPEVALVVTVGDRWLLDLTWGPTLSFKDYALQIVGALFGRVMERRSERLVILGATSGDTGAAAIEACRGLPGVDIVMLLPDGGVSDVQRRQMTTVPDANVHAVAVAGSFDDCQRLVKQAFSQLPDASLAAVNSINWARIVAQSAYYVHAAAMVGTPIHVVVPTGNFGNVLSAHMARRMGAPIAGLTAANNANHGLSDLVATGRLVVDRVTATTSPAMDIQVPSNLERYLFELVDGDPTRVEQLQAQLASEGSLRLDADLHGRLRHDFSAAWRPDSDVTDTIRKVFETTGAVIDPHTAVAWSVADEVGHTHPLLVVGTAHPAKFPEAVTEAIGTPPDLPADVEAGLSRPERVVRLPADGDALRELILSLR